jgi:transposase
MELPFSNMPSEATTRWFGPFSCVVHDTEEAKVFVSGLLIGSFTPSDVFSRNVLLVELSRERQIKKGALAAAFGVTDDHRRRICRIAEEQGLQAVPGRKRGGSEQKLRGRTRKKVLKLFSEGHRPVHVYRDHGKALGVSYTTILRLHQKWSKTDGEEIPAKATSREPQQLSILESTTEEAIDAGGNEESETPGLPTDGSDERTFSSKNEPATTPLRSGKNIQHLGGLLLVAMVIVQSVRCGTEGMVRQREVARSSSHGV